MLKEELERVSGESRAERLAALVAERGARPAAGRRPGAPQRDSGRDASANLRWLTGFTRHQRPGDRGRRRSASSSPTSATSSAPSARWRPSSSGWRSSGSCSPTPRSGCAAGSATTTRRRASGTSRKLEELAPEGVELVAAGGLVERLRRRKDDGGARGDRRGGAARRPGLRVGLRAGRGGEDRARDHARRPPADARARRRGPVVSGDRRGRREQRPAAPRAPPSARCGAGELLLIDMGAIVDGYCSDCTRTVATGELDDEAREVYELVRSAQASALDGDPRRRARAARPTPSPATRSPRPATASEFGHGLGHGVGIEVHEAPRLSQELRADARGRRRGHGRAGRLPPGPLRRPDRGPGDGHRRRLPQLQRLPEGAAGRRLSA